MAACPKRQLYRMRHVARAVTQSFLVDIYSDLYAFTSATALIKYISRKSNNLEYLGGGGYVFSVLLYTCKHVTRNFVVPHFTARSLWCSCSVVGSTHNSFLGAHLNLDIRMSADHGIGVIGLGVMGSSLAMNLAERSGLRVAGVDLTPEKVHMHINERGGCVVGTVLTTFRYNTIGKKCSVVYDYIR